MLPEATGLDSDTGFCDVLQESVSARMVIRNGGDPNFRFLPWDFLPVLFVKALLPSSSPGSSSSFLRVPRFLGQPHGLAWKIRANARLAAGGSKPIPAI